MKSLAFLLATTAALLPYTAIAQDVAAEPTYETVELSAGFPDDPYIVSLLSGGEVDASSVGEGCYGYIADAPDVRLNYEADSLPLYISVASEADTTLVVNAPDGQWYCDDDSNGNANPIVWYETPLAGQYDIWVGTFSDSTNHAADLAISEIASDSMYTDTGYDTGDDEGYEVETTGTGIDFGAEPTYETVNLSAGFTPDPYTVALSSGGGNDASQLGDPCTGYVADVPDVRLNYEAGSLPLFIRTQSEADTTLAINAPDGQWYCDDDGGFDVNAQVWFDAPQSGQYDIFVGTYGDTTLNDATLEISEIQLAE